MKYVYAFSAIALWSSNAYIAQLALKDLSVQQILLLQFIGATFVFWGMRRYASHGPNGSVSLMAGLLGLLGLTGTVTLQYIAFSIGPITETNVITYAWPLFVALFVIAAKKSPNPRTLLILALFGFAGSALILGGGSLDSFAAHGLSFGFVAAISSAFCMASYTILIGKMRISPENVLLPGALVGVIGTAIICFLCSTLWSASWSLVLGLYLGIGPMGMGYYLWSRAMQTDTQGTLALMGYMTPVLSTAILISAGKSVETTVAIGIAIVILSSSLIGVKMVLRDHAEAT